MKTMSLCDFTGFIKCIKKGLLYLNSEFIKFDSQKKEENLYVIILQLSCNE